ncbi:Oidioi.mRNA.OKI2018_I69.PAR.g10051.t1.cds [Oikopleura dioica]|uniref:Oidioi.mRNA.OKI2018_I69.PAR.g10051.t1.cds n=1 Tax=Oikopleura dioica TaxID=34765 RepID=A0ABN7RUJ4_OIKDI|nr:Oidioi.mRNA.OKI2018_I69.PAR.g10051.t1.cds [Oikopleura dioica]
MKKNSKISKRKFWTLARLFLLEKLRKPLDLVLLLTVPSLSSILLLSFRESIARDYDTPQVNLPPIISSKVYPKRFSVVDTHEILFTPDTPRNFEIINKTCSDIGRKFSGYDFFGNISQKKRIVPKGFSTVEDMEEYIHSRSKNSTLNIFLGVHFHSEVSKKLDFTIRTVPTAGKYPIKGNWKGWMGHLTSPTIFGKMITNTIGSTLIDDHSQWSLYYTEAFLPVQNSIQKQFLEQNGVKNDAEQILQPFRQSVKLTATFAEMARQQLHLIFMIGFAHFVQHVIRTITRHREEHRLDYLSLVGASPKDIILAHHFVSLVFQSIASAIVSFSLTAKISTNGAIFPHTSFSVIWLLLTAYGSSLIFVCHFASTFFKTPTTAATVTSAIIFFISVPHGFISTSWRLMPFLLKIAIILNPTILLALGCDMICHYEGKKMALSLNKNFFKRIFFEDPLGMVDVIFYLLLTTLFYFYLTLKIENIKSRKLNSQKKTDAFRFEVQNLSKFYSSSGQVALKNVSFKTEEKTITVLLGENGSGKSTLLSILCGFVEPTSGSDLIGSGNCGYCPQHNIFFEFLTVKEHFEIFSELSAESSFDHEEIESLAKDVQLSEKLENFPNQLSGGMLRKLSLGLSIIGRPKRLLLDEPSSGLDPVSRKELWGILKSLSSATSILMSTHYMDEAENLANSVIFLKDGQLPESGSLKEMMKDEPSFRLSSFFDPVNTEKGNWQLEERIKTGGRRALYRFVCERNDRSLQLYFGDDADDGADWNERSGGENNWLQANSSAYIEPEKASLLAHPVRHLSNTVSATSCRNDGSDEFFIKSPNFLLGLDEFSPVFFVCIRFFIAHMPVAFILGHLSEDKGSFIGHHSNVNIICTVLMFMSATCAQIFTGNEQESSLLFQLCFGLSSIYWMILFFLENCDDELTPIEETNSVPNSEESIQIKNITKIYKEKQRKKEVLKDVSFNLHRGETICLLGSNGAGKTTLLSILCQLKTPSSGFISRSGRIGYCRQQDCLLDNLTVEETIEILLGTRGIENCQRVAKEISSLVDIVKYSKRLTKELSGGAKRKLSVAISILNNPDFIVLDEPSSGLDPSARIKMKSLLQVFEKLNKGVLVSTHVEEESKILGSTSIFLDRGRVKEIIKY